MYPYGNWFENESQQFDSHDQLYREGLTDHVEKKATQSSAFHPEKNEEYEDWRVSLKPGVFKIASITAAPIIPTYVEHEHGKWKIRIGEPIYVQVEKQDGESYHQAKQRVVLDAEKRYLAEMRKLKSN